jgi:hypothetical protein
MPAKRRTIPLKPAPAHRATPHPCAEDLARRLEYVADRDAPPGNVLPPLCALLLRLARQETELERPAADPGQARPP